ncbi:hypothetical protein ACPPVV_18745 [Rhodanobacter sp. Col0626]|uniref:hypothetical protein n=1 Tax=Rhodanobacter sp. Col0626 TaxID=3415679 RepID=UPI003CE74C63
METPDQITCYQAIGNALSGVAPAGWSFIEANVTLAGSRVDAVVSYQAAQGSGHLTGVPMLARSFYELARLISTEEKGLFKSCTFKLYSSGKYDASYTY